MRPTRFLGIRCLALASLASLAFLGCTNNGPADSPAAPSAPADGGPAEEAKYDITHRASGHNCAKMKQCIDGVVPEAVTADNAQRFIEDVRKCLLDEGNSIWWSRSCVPFLVRDSKNREMNVGLYLGPGDVLRPGHEKVVISDAAHLDHIECVCRNLELNGLKMEELKKRHPNSGGDWHDYHSCRIDTMRKSELANVVEHSFVTFRKTSRPLVGGDDEVWKLYLRSAQLYVALNKRVGVLNIAAIDGIKIVENTNLKSLLKKYSAVPPKKIVSPGGYTVEYRSGGDIDGIWDDVKRLGLMEIAKEKAPSCGASWTTSRTIELRVGAESNLIEYDEACEDELTVAIKSIAKRTRALPSVRSCTRKSMSVLDDICSPELTTARAISVFDRAISHSGTGGTKVVRYLDPPLVSALCGMFQEGLENIVDTEELSTRKVSRRRSANDRN